MSAASSADGAADPRPVQRTVVHVVVTDPGQRVLLVRGPRSARWSLPVVALGHGEHPRDAALRALAAFTGGRAQAVEPVAAWSDVFLVPSPGLRVHTIRLVYAAAVDDAQVSSPGPGFTVEYVGRDDAGARPLTAPAAQVLGSPAPADEEPEPPLEDDRAEMVDDEPVAPLPSSSSASPAASGAASGAPVRVQRPAAYAVLVDEPRSRILLSRLADTDELWTLPGGGIDFGEPPLVALEREMYEETGLPYTAGPLLDIGSRYFTGRAPNGRLEDFHGVRLIYTGSVPLDVPPQVTEIDGSTDLAAWVDLADLDRLRVASTVRDALRQWSERRPA